MSLRSPCPSKLLLLAVLSGLLVFLAAAAPSLSQVAPALQEPSPTPEITPEALPTPLPGVPVTLGSETLFYVFQRSGPLTPAERAALLSERIAKLAGDPFAPPLEITTAESAQGIDLLIGDQVLMTITENDASAAGMSREEAASLAAQTIQDAVHKYRQEQTPQARLGRFLLALAILVGLVAFLFLLNWLFERALLLIDRRTEAQAAAHAGGAQDIFHSRFWRGLVRLLFNLARAVVYITLLFIVMPLILRLFPLTLSIANQISGFISNMLSSIWGWFATYRTDLFIVLVIILVIYGLTRLVNAFMSELGQGAIRFSHFEPEWAPFTSRIINFLLVVGAVVVAFPYIPGSDSDAFRGITIFLGALFTLSSTAAVTNIVAGVIQTYTRAFKVGDVIRIADITGMVIEKRLLTTLVRTYWQEDVSYPNSLIMNSSVVNYSALARTSGLVLYTTVTIGYDVPWRTVHGLLLEAAEKTPGLLKDPPPFVLQTSLNDYHVSYQINVYTKEAERMPRIYSLLHENIQDGFNQAGIEIMSPAFSALRDGNTVTIPEENRPSGYKAPGFRVER